MLFLTRLLYLYSNKKKYNLLDVQKALVKFRKELKSHLIFDSESKLFYKKKGNSFLWVRESEEDLKLYSTRLFIEVDILISEHNTNSIIIIIKTILLDQTNRYSNAIPF
jgi:hypothetical protein